MDDQITTYDPFIHTVLQEHRVSDRDTLNRERWDTLIEAIEQMSNLKNDWDNQGCIVATPEMFEFIIRKAHEMNKRSIRHPDGVMMTFDGSLHLEWHVDEVIILHELEGIRDGQAYGNIMASMSDSAKPTHEDWTVPAWKV